LCLAIIGVPGAGKTTLLRYLALTYARHHAQERLELDEERLPVFIALRDFNRFLDNAERCGELLDLNPQLLPHFLNEHLTTIAPHLQLPADLFEHALTKGRCAVLLDGLDEVADPLKRARVAEAVVTFVRHYRGNRFVVTSRPRGYEGEAKQRLSLLCADCTIRDFDDNDMAEFAHSWYEAVTRDRLGDNPDAIAEARSQADDLLRAIHTDERVKALAHNPLLLSVLAMVHQRGVGLPQRRAELYDECTDTLLGYWDQTKGGEAARELATYGELNRSEKRALLEPVALWFHERGVQGLEADKEELEREIARQFKATFGDNEPKAQRRAALFLRVIEERAGLLVERETGVYAFAHLTFQEYLAARAIADREDYIEYTLRHLHDLWWREVILLEVGHLSDVRHFGRRARKLTSDLIRAIRNAGSWLEPVLKRDLLLAARCLADVGKLGVDDDLRQSLVDELFSLWRTTRYAKQRVEAVNVFTYYMGTANEERVVKELLHALQDKDADPRLRAAEALGQLGLTAASDPVLSALLQALQDPYVYVNCWAARALGQLGQEASEAALSVLLHALQDMDANVRFRATQTLGWLGPAAANEPVLSALLHALRDTDVSVRFVAVYTLGQLGAAACHPHILSALLDALQDLDINVRSMAARALGQLGAATSEVVLNALLPALQSQDAFVRSIVAEALGQLGAAAASKPVLSALLQTLRDQDVDVRARAAQALGQFGLAAASDTILSALLRALRDEDVTVRRTAAWAFGQLEPKTAGDNVLSALLDALQDEDRGVRFAAAWTLGQLAGSTPEVRSVLTEFWGGQLDVTELVSFGDRDEPACDIAFEQLWRMAESATL
jgi:HEAT repeat protein